MAFNSPILDLSSTTINNNNNDNNDNNDNNNNRSLAPPIVPHNTSPSFLINDYSNNNNNNNHNINNNNNRGPPSPSAAYHAFSNHEVYRGVYHQDALVTASTITSSNNNITNKDSFGIYSNNSNNSNTNNNNNKSASGFDLDYVVKHTSSLSLSDNNNNNNNNNSSLPYSPSEPKGGYLEPMTHFGSDREPLLLLNDLKTILSDLLVDYDTIPNKFKIRCVSYSGEHRHGNATKFIIRIFSWPNDDNNNTTDDDETDPADNINNNNNNNNNEEESEEENGGGGHGYETEKLTKGKYAVEFQRREGDIFHFYEIFHATKDAMAAIPTHINTDINNNNNSASSSSGAYLSPYRATLKLTLSTPPPIPSSSINHDQLISALKCLQQMCASDCVDVKIQAALALTDLTYNINNDIVLNTLINAKIIDDLFRCFLCTSEDVSRAALTGLANIVKLRSDICEKIIKENTILIKLKESSLSRTAEIVRESARTIDNIINTLPVAIDSPIIQDCIKILEASKITKASDIAKKIKASKR